MKTNNKGFSLVELIVVIAIMAILAAVAIPTFAGFITKANEASDASFLNDVAYAAELLAAEQGTEVTKITVSTKTDDSKIVVDAISVTCENTSISVTQDAVAEIADTSYVFKATATGVTWTYENGAWTKPE